MALPVLDGNQTATTLSSVVTGGEHIVAHSVVSLGANAIANITSAVSGSVVSVSNFPASQSTTFGAVTGSVSVLNFPSTQTVAGTVTANVVGYNSSSNQTGPLNLAFGQESFADGSRIGVALIDNDGNEFGTNFPLSVAGTVTANLSSSNLNSVTIGIRGTVTVGNSVTIGSLPDIAIGISPVYDSGDDSLNVNIKNIGGGASLSPSNTFPISGTVTANIGNLGSYSLVDQAIAQGINNYGEQPLFSIPVINESGQSLAISGTVTANNPNGALTTRFGSVTTANTAQITSAVTNTSRKYLLAQNISAGTVTIGIGFSPTTTQGIQLTAGAGLTFDAFCPTGAVYWLGAVTGAAFTILEG